MLIPALLAFGLTLAISPAVLVGLRRFGVLDIPTHRSSHVEPTPRGGGVAVGIGAASALVTATSVPSRPATGMLVAACGLGLVGLLDDLVDVPALWRLMCQFAPAAVASIWLVPSSSRPAIVHIGLVCLVTLWLVSYVNAFNFMDGINGISVAQTVVAGGAWAVVAEVRDIPMLGTAGRGRGRRRPRLRPLQLPQGPDVPGRLGQLLRGCLAGGGGGGRAAGRSPSGGHGGAPGPLPGRHRLHPPAPGVAGPDLARRPPRPRLPAPGRRRLEPHDDDPHRRASCSWW